MNINTKKLLEICGYNKLEESKQKKLKSTLNQVIEKWEGNETAGAYSVINGMMAQLGCNKLNEDATNEIHSKFIELINKEAGFHNKTDFLWNVGGQIAPLRETVVTGAHITGKDSNLQGDIYHRRKDKDGLHRQEPKKRPYDKSEIDIEKQLEKILQLFMNRNKKKITLTDLKRIMPDLSIEERSNVKHKLSAASALIEDDPSCESELLEHYFEQGKILNESSGGSSSSTSWNNWQGVSYEVYVDSSGRVKSSNSFLARVGETIDQNRIEYLKGKGLTIIKI